LSPRIEPFEEAIEGTGIDGRKIKEALVLIGPPSGEKMEDMPSSLPEIAAVIQMSEPADIDMLVESTLEPPPWGPDKDKQGEEVEYAGTTYYKPASSNKPLFYASEDKTLLIMARPEDVMKRLLDEPGDAPALANEMVELGAHDLAVVALTDSDEKREQLLAAVQSAMPTEYKEEKWDDSKEGPPPEVEMIQQPVPPQVKSMLEKLNSLHAYFTRNSNWTNAGTAPTTSNSRKRPVLRLRHRALKKATKPALWFSRATTPHLVGRKQPRKAIEVRECRTSRTVCLARLWLSMRVPRRP